MSLEETIADIQKELRKGSFANERAVSNGAVLPVLNALQWPVFNTSIVSPEYTVGQRRVDYALRGSGGRPIVFLEVKRVGLAYAGEEQLLGYAFHEGVPLAVLTDGQEWSFYIPAQQGAFQERRVYKLDILERGIDECSWRLNRYLGRGDVMSGSALEHATTDLQDTRRRTETELYLPRALTSLMEEADELLVELLSDKVEDLCGYKPGPETCAEFLTATAGNTGASTSDRRPPEIHITPVSSQDTGGGYLVSRPPQQQNVDQVGYVLRGQRYPCRNAIEVKSSAFERFAQDDPTFPERFAARKHGSRRRYLARDKYELYPGQRDLCERASRQLTFGWYIGTNYSKATIQKIIRLACEVAGWRFGEDFSINLG